MSSSINPENAMNVLSDYFDIHLPKADVIEILLDNPDLLAENNAGEISDTIIRDQLIDTTLKYIGIQLAWPTYGDSEAYSSEFFDKLDGKIAERNNV